MSEERDDARTELSAVVVAFNSADMIGETIEHLYEIAPDSGFEVITIENPLMTTAMRSPPGQSDAAGPSAAKPTSASGAAPTSD